MAFVYECNGYIIERNTPLDLEQNPDCVMVQKSDDVVITAEKPEPKETIKEKSFIEKYGLIIFIAIAAILSTWTIYLLNKQNG